MIRYNYINKQVLRVYALLDHISFPINPKEIINQFVNCRYMSYQTFAKINGCTVDEVIEMCESKSGCTHYQIENDRYLVLCNESTDNNNNYGRQRWTCLHEIGHILCGHHKKSAIDLLSENRIPGTENKEFESEADYFAAMVAAPFPLFDILGIRSVIDVQNTFGLSSEASLYRFTQYIKWKKDHRKTAWENDMVHLYMQKGNSF